MKASSKFQGISNILFDLDDTLCDYRKAATETLNVIFDDLKTRYRQLANRELLSVYQRAVKETIELLEKGVLDDGQYQFKKWKRFVTLCEMEDDVLARSLANIYLVTIVSKIRVFDDVHKVLPTLRSKYELGLLTNGPGWFQRLKILWTNLEQYFYGNIFVAGETGYRKPNERIFLHAMDRMGISASETAYVGDSIKEDVLGAKKAGLLAIWLNRKNKELKETGVKPNYEIKTLYDLPFL
jgi:putative hydrolase of the HAD superfamily